MAAGNDYPGEIINANGDVTEGITLRFLDSANQPSGPLPLSIPDTNTATPIVNVGDTPFFSLNGATGDATFLGVVQAGGLGGSIIYVTESASPPGADYQTPLYYDSTAVTGGLYAWTGGAYLKIGNLVT